MGSLDFGVVNEWKSGKLPTISGPNKKESQRMEFQYFLGVHILTDYEYQKGVRLTKMTHEGRVECEGIWARLTIDKMNDPNQ